MPITYPPNIDVGSFNDALTGDSHQRQDRLRQRQQLPAQRHSSGSVAQNSVTRRSCGVTQLCLEIGATHSMSFSPAKTKRAGYYEWDRTHPTIPRGRFHFVPGDPSNATLGVGGEVCTIRYALHKPTRIRAATLELFRANDPRPLLSVTLRYNAAQLRLEPTDPTGPVRLRGNDLVWDGRLDRNRDRVGGRVIDVNSSPYKLKLSVQPTRSVWLRHGEAWTYFDVVVDSLQLEWGDDVVLPLNRADVDGRFQADVRTNEVALLQDLKLNAVAGGLVLDANDHRLPLPSNLFTTDLESQSGTDRPFRSYRDMWGYGPLIPIYAAVKLARSDGSLVDARTAPWALGKAEFVWDWEDDPTNKPAQWAAAPQRTRDYVDHAIDYLVDVEAEAGEAPRGSNNCHVHHGGKRGAGAQPVFPVQNPINYTDHTAALIANEFLFAVGPCPNRRWAAISKPRTAGIAAGLTGVLFQPSRIAGDRYRVAAYLSPREGFDWHETGANLRASTIPHAASGVFEVWRRVNAWVYRADATVGAINAGIVRTIFEEARIDLDLPAPAAVNPGHWQDAFLTGLADYMNYSNKSWLGAMLAATQAGPDCVQFGDAGNAVAHVTALANTGLWEVQVTGANDASLKPGEPVEHPGSNTRGFVVHREQAGAGHLLYVENALGQHLALGPNLRILRGNITLNIVACQRMNAPLNSATVAGRLQALCDVTLTPQAYSQVSKGISTRVMREYVNATHAGVKGVFFFVFRQMGTHANESRAGGTNSTIATETLAFAYLQDDPTVAMPGAALKAFDLVAAHELGHALFLPHSPHESPCKPKVHIEVLDNEHDNCIMNYHTTSQHFCGMCMLRLMGWSLHGASEVANADAQLVKLSNQDRNKCEFEMQTLRATLPVTPPRTVRPLHNSTNLNVATRATVNGAATIDLAGNAPVVLLTGSAGPAPVLADPQRQAVCGPLRLEAHARMPNGARYVWKVERAPDDHAQVCLASPNPLPTLTRSGPNNEFCEVETDATGTFHVKASVDVTGGAAFDDAAAFLCINLVLVKVERLKSDHTFKKRQGGCWVSGTDMMIGTQRGNESVPVRLRTKIKLIGGGGDGQRGLDRVSSGWINNVRSDSTGANYLANDGSGNQWHVHTLPLHRDAGGAACARLVPAPSDAAPVVDKSTPQAVMTNWQARHAVLSVAQPNPADPLSLHLVAQPIGGHCWIAAEDAPAQGWDIHPPTLPNFNIERLWLRTEFTAYLCLWTHSAPCLIGVIEEHPWEIDGEYDVDHTGPRRARTKMRVTALPKRKHATLVAAVDTGLEWCPPGSLTVYKPRHFPIPESPALDLGFSWGDPTTR